MRAASSSKNRTDQVWDAIVIGSGLGGLTAAAYLTTNGLRTLVLERYDTVGGCSHVFRRKRRFEFDVGLHYIGDCAPGGAIPTVLRGVGLEGKIEFLELDPDGFSTLVFPDLTFRVPRGWDRYLERLVDTFPEEERGLVRCIGVLERIGREFDRGSETRRASPRAPATEATRNRRTQAHLPRSRGA
jgi:phytoene dehydrogenase-like protein